MSNEPKVERANAYCTMQSNQKMKRIKKNQIQITRERKTETNCEQARVRVKEIEFVCHNLWWYVKLQ